MNEVHSEVMVFETPQVNTPMIPEWEPITAEDFWQKPAAEREAICTSSYAETCAGSVMVRKSPAVPDWAITDTGIKRFWEMSAAEREEVCAIPKWVWVS